MQATVVGAAGQREQVGFGLNSFLLESGCAPRARSHWEGVGANPNLPELTRHLHLALRSTEHLALKNLVFWFFSPEFTCQDWTFCDLPVNLASPSNGALVLHQTGDTTAWTQQEPRILPPCPQIWSRAGDLKSGMG